MEGGWKGSAWDPTGLRGQKNGETWVDLRLGETCGSGENSTPDTTRDQRVLKRSRMPQKVTCSVDGCKFDLTNCKAYHRRHRVCEMHSKSPMVLVDGKQLRFCQQCSRFQSLEEFDATKRSCRRRLEGHNRRRRKANPPSLGMTADRFLNNYNGPTLLRLGTPQAYGYPFMTSMWPMAAKSEAEAMSYGHHPPMAVHKIEQPSLVSSFVHGQDKQVPFLQPQAYGPRAGYGYEAVPGISGTTALAASRYESHSACAFYLLSPVQMESAEVSLAQSSIGGPIQAPIPLGDVQFDGTDEQLWSESASNKAASLVLVQDSNTTNHHHYNEMPRSGPDDQLTQNGGSLMFPFWQ